MLPLLLVATCAFVGFFGLIFGLFCYRKELKVWVHSGCLGSLCYKSGTFVNEYDKDRLYDAYITYSLQDEHFVNQILAATLENDVGFRLCLHYRDFNTGSFLADTIVEAVESSKRAVLVLSKNFLYNEWTRFEFKGAVHEVLKRRRKLIIILYGDLPQRDLDADLRLYLRTNTCIEWDDKKFWQKLRIAMPQVKKSNCLNKRSAINIYATANEYNTTGRRRLPPGCPAGTLDTLPSVAIGPPVAVTRLEQHSYATIGNCPRNCDNYDTVNNCKYNTTQHQHTHQPPERRVNELGQKAADRQHEYAIPSSCLLDTTNEVYSTSCDRVASETFECTSSSKYSTSSRGSSDCSHSISSIHDVSGATAGQLPNGSCPPNGLSTTNFTYHHPTSSSRKPSNTGGGRSTKDASEASNSNANNFNDRRLPQAMWA